MIGARDACVAADDVHVVGDLEVAQDDAPRRRPCSARRCARCRPRPRSRPWPCARPTRTLCPICTRLSSFDAVLEHGVVAGRRGRCRCWRRSRQSSPMRTGTELLDLLPAPARRREAEAVGADHRRRRARCPRCRCEQVPAQHHVGLEPGACHADHARLRRHGVRHRRTAPAPTWAPASTTDEGRRAGRRPSADAAPGATTALGVHAWRGCGRRARAAHHWAQPRDRPWYGSAQTTALGPQRPPPRGQRRRR
jgi:hypothetical protein